MEPGAITSITVLNRGFGPALYHMLRSSENIFISCLYATALTEQIYEDFPRTRQKCTYIRVLDRSFLPLHIVFFNIIACSSFPLTPPQVT